MANHVEIGTNTYWVGARAVQGGLQCNPYLIVDEEEAVLIDPGSVLDIAEVYANVLRLVSPEKINYVILHHQDPDFCTGVPYLEKQGLRFQIVTHWRTVTMLRYYGIQSEYYLVNENTFRLTLRSGRMLDFVSTPYLHGAGAIMTYDQASKILFSSDLFGAFSSEWSLFAGSDYMERMKAFHEHYMPSNEILRPVMETLLTMDIASIAPQHGSVITENPTAYIQELKAYEYGLITPQKKKQISSKGYYDIIGRVVKRLGVLYSKGEVLEAVKGLELMIDEETLEVVSPDASGSSLWNPGQNRWELLFELILARRGIAWLTAIEPLVHALCNDYDISMPHVFKTNLKQVQQLVNRLSQENARLQEVNEGLQSSIQETANRLNRCPVTGFYNYSFFRNYLTTEISKLTWEKQIQDPVLLIIAIDNMAQIKFAHGDREADECLKNLAQILRVMATENSLLFRLQGASFACYWPMVKFEQGMEWAESLKNAVNSAETFIEKINLSLGLARFSEVKEPGLAPEKLADKLYDSALLRVKIAKAKGSNRVVAFSDLDSSDLKEKKVLIVDADPINLDVLSTFFEVLDVEVLTAGDGEEALAIAESEPLAAIITEIMLPKMDAFQLRAQLLSRSNTKDILFILVSYLKSEDSVKRAVGLGIEYYFKKPFMISELTGLLKNKLKG